MTKKNLSETLKFLVKENSKILEERKEFNT